jgi:integrase
MFAEHNLHDVVIAALDTGFRKSELLPLTWLDIDWRRRTLTVRAAYTKGCETRMMLLTERLTPILQARKVHHTGDGVLGTAPVIKPSDAQS